MTIAKPVAADQQTTAVGSTIARVLADWRVALALLSLGVVQQSLGHLNADNSWLITVAERVLAGAMPYVDIIETNPPASFILYLPAVWAATVLHVSPEFMTSAFVFAGAIGATLFAGQILVRAGLLSTAEAGLLLTTAAFVHTFMPGASFAEREHIAGFAIMPLLAVFAARSQGKSVPLLAAIVAGLIGGAVVDIKPHFALAALLPLAYVLWCRRSLWPAFAPENLAVIAMGLAYVAISMLRYPAFFDALPYLIEAYVAIQSPLKEIVAQPWFLVNVALIASGLLLFGRRCLDPVVALGFLGSLGFLGAYLLQSKGWVNHGLPGVALAILAVARLVAPAVTKLAQGHTEEWSEMRLVALYGLAPCCIIGPLLFGVQLQFKQWEEYKGLTAAVARHAPPQPKLIVVSSELDIGHPLVRRVNGTWAGRPHSLWLTMCSLTLIAGKVGDEAYRARLAKYIDIDARMFREDVAVNRPDLILVDASRRTKRAIEHPEIAAALAGYAPVETVSDVTLWKRKP